MKMNAVVAGVGMTRFGKHLESGLKAIGAEAVEAALKDAGMTGADIEAAYVGNAAAGLVTGQECIRGQVVLRSAGIGKNNSANHYTDTNHGEDRPAVHHHSHKAGAAWGEATRAAFSAGLSNCVSTLRLSNRVQSRGPITFSRKTPC